MRDDLAREDQIVVGLALVVALVLLVVGAFAYF